jgi:hypothetical protein
MRKLLVLICICTGVLSLSAHPKGGGYLGKRLIICAEASYMPNYSAWKDLYTSYNFQYGGNIHFVTGRYSQIGVSCNMYSLGAHNRYEETLSDDGRIRGYQIGLTYRKFVKNKGGLAPIGKFFDVNLYYHSDEYSVEYKEMQPFAPVIISSTGLSGSVAFGTQGIFWNRVVGNMGVRFGGPIVTLQEEGSPFERGREQKYMKERLMYKDFFSVFFGIGIIL